MEKQAKNEAFIPNIALEPFSVLVGEWQTTGSHPKLPTALHGRTSIAWMDGGAFLKMLSEVDEEGVPSSTAIFGSDNVLKEFYLIYFDERGISRKYNASLIGNVWRLWREAPEFSQRFTGTFSDDGDTIVGVWEMCEDGETWKHDLEMTYTRVK